MMNRRFGLIPLLGSLALVLSACAGPTFASLPLPGNSVSGDTIKVSAPFDEALNLQKGAPVSINGVMSGRVTGVTANDFHAKVNMVVQTAAHLRLGATARLRYTTPLGELYIEVKNPLDGPLMTDGSSFPKDATVTAPTVEDALAQASTLINGGGLNQLQVIVTEANKALGGHEDSIRGVIEQTGTAMTQLNAASSDIDRALNSLATASKVLNDRKATIQEAVQAIGPAAQSLAANTDKFTALLASLNAFGANANSFVGQTKAQILETVTSAEPLLQELAKSSSQLAPTLQAVINAAATLQKAIPGDYLNLFAVLKLGSISLTTPSAPGAPPGGGGGILPGLPVIPSLPQLPIGPSGGVSGLTCMLVKIGCS